VGFNSFYLSKQEGPTSPGDVPNVKSNASTPPVASTENPQFIVEKYARIKVKNQVSLSDGVVSLSELNSEIIRLRSLDPEGSLSDYFGDLRFTYKGSFFSLMEKGFADLQSISRLADLNKGTDVNVAMLQNSMRKYIGSQQFEDFDVIYDDYFVLSGENPEPFGTTGRLDIDYGLRVCLVLPSNYLTPQQAVQLQSLSNSERSYYFADGTVIIPLIETEVSAIDESLSSYNPESMYDLECLVNKMSESTEFKIMFNKVFPLGMFSSMSAIFNSENFMPSIGRGPGERTKEALSIIEAGLDEDEWEGITNEFLKNYLRRQFRSNYLSNDMEGFSIEALSERERLRLFGNFNPFDIFSLPSVKIPWFRKRRLKLKVYDAYDNECADPTKDFE
jgi:hypothetical protein